jgi:hypothetical protein
MKKKPPSVDELLSYIKALEKELKSIKQNIKEEVREAVKEKMSGGEIPPALELGTDSISSPKIIKDLIDAGQLDKEPQNDRYKPYKSMPQFIQWCFNNGYGDDISKQFILKNIHYRGHSERSIGIYLGKAKKGVIKTQ